MRRPVRVVLSVALVVLFVAGGVRLADPFAPTAGAVPEYGPDGADSPAELAHAAMVRSEAIGYETTVRREHSEGTRRLVVAAVDNRHGRVRVRYPRADAVVFGTASGGWRRPVDRRGPTAWSRDPLDWDADGAFVHDDAVLEPDANVTVAGRNRSTVVLVVRDTDTAFELVEGVENVTGTEYAREENLTATLTLVVDRDDGTLRRGVFDTSRRDGTGPDADRRETRTVRTFSSWGDVDVRRPAWVPYRPEDALADFLAWGQRGVGA